MLLQLASTVVYGPQHVVTLGEVRRKLERPRLRIALQVGVDFLELVVWQELALLEE